MIAENHEYVFRHSDKGFITNTPRGYKIVPKMVKDLAKDGKVTAFHEPSGKTYRVNKDGIINEEAELQESGNKISDKSTQSLIEAISSAAKLKSLIKQLTDGGYEEIHSYQAGKYSSRYFKHPKSGDRKVIRFGKILDIDESIEMANYKLDESVISPLDAHGILTKHDALNKNFFTLRPDQVTGMLNSYKEVTGRHYRAYKYAPGSTGRMLHQHLNRLANKIKE